MSAYELLFRTFCMILYALSSSPFYTTYVHLLTIHDAVPSEILSNPKLFPFFEGAIGAMDRTHIKCCPSSKERHLSYDRKGRVSQNTLACCGLDMQFQYMISGRTDVQQIQACTMMPDFQTLHFLKASTTLQMQGLGCVISCWFFIRDSLSFGRVGTCLSLVGFSCFLSGKAHKMLLRPANKEELYNIQHVCAQNVVERIFGMLNCHFVILTHPPEWI